MRALANISLLCLACLLLPQFVAAQSSSLSSAISELPTCALNCLAGAIAHSPCSLTNQTCICTNAPLQANVTACVTETCTIKEGLFTKNLTQTTCDAPVRNRSNMIANTAIALGVLSAATVIARFCVKFFIIGANPSLDDYFILITLLVGVPSTILIVRGAAANGLGQDVWSVPFDHITNFLRVFYFMEVLYFLQVALLKLSLLFFYLRIFPTKHVQMLLWATVIFDILFGLSFFFSAIFQCKPIDFYWTRWDGEHSGRCLNINALGWANAAISIVLDIWMLVVPLSQLSQLQLHWKKKIGVGLMFCVGTFVTVVSILRLRSLVDFANSMNPTWDQLQVIIWSTLEINVGIICTCMPAIRVILVKLFPKVLGSTKASRKQYFVSNSAGSKLRNRSRSRSRNRSQNRSQTLSNKQLPSLPPSEAESHTSNAIVYSKSYNVEFEDNDEEKLVQMNDLDPMTGKAMNP